MKIDDSVRVTKDPKSIGKVSGFPRTGVVMVKLNRAQDGVTHWIGYEHELEEA